MPYDNDIDYSNPPASVLSENQNFASPNSFMLAIDNLNRPNVQYTGQQVSMPGLSLPGTVLSTPQRNVTVPGDKIVYSALSLTFIVEETFANYREIHDWMVFNATSAEEIVKNKTRDMTLLLYSSSNNVIQEIRYSGAHPVDLSPLSFDVTSESVAYLTATVEFEYDYYKFL